MPGKALRAGGFSTRQEENYWKVLRAKASGQTIYIGGIGTSMLSNPNQVGREILKRGPLYGYNFQFPVYNGTMFGQSGAAKSAIVGSQLTSLLATMATLPADAAKIAFVDGPTNDQPWNSGDMTDEQFLADLADYHTAINALISAGCFVVYMGLVAGTKQPQSCSRHNTIMGRYCQKRGIPNYNQFWRIIFANDGTKNSAYTDATVHLNQDAIDFAAREMFNVIEGKSQYPVWTAYHNAEYDNDGKAGDNLMSNAMFTTAAEAGSTTGWSSSLAGNTFNTVTDTSVPGNWGRILRTTTGDAFIFQNSVDFATAGIGVGDVLRLGLRYKHTLVGNRSAMKIRIVEFNVSNADPYGADASTFDLDFPGAVLVQDIPIQNPASTAIRIQLFNEDMTVGTSDGEVCFTGVKLINLTKIDELIANYA